MKNRNYTGFFNNSKNAPVLKRKKEKIAKEKKVIPDPIEDRKFQE